MSGAAYRYPASGTVQAFAPLLLCLSVPLLQVANNCIISLPGYIDQDDDDDLTMTGARCTGTGMIAAAASSCRSLSSPAANVLPLPGAQHISSLSTPPRPPCSDAGPCRGDCPFAMPSASAT